MRRGGDMGIGIQGEPGGEVPQYAADGLDVHTVLKGDGCEGVAEVDELNHWDTCSSSADRIPRLIGFAEVLRRFLDNVKMLA